MEDVLGSRPDTCNHRPDEPFQHVQGGQDLVASVSTGGPVYPAQFVGRDGVLNFVSLCSEAKLNG